MAYEKTIWKDRAVEKPRTFNIVNNPDGTITLIPAPGTVVEEGTPVNAANMNKIEVTLEGHSKQMADLVPKTDFNEHLTDKASQDELGHISFADMPGLWQKIDEINISVDILQVDINIFKNYKDLLVVLDTIGTEVTSQARNLKLNFNDSLTSYFKNGSGSSETYIPLAGMLSNHIYNSINELIPHHAEIFISNGVNAKVGCALFSGANTYSGLSFIWNSPNSINKISITSDSATSKIKSGSIIKVWGR